MGPLAWWQEDSKCLEEVDERIAGAAGGNRPSPLHSRAGKQREKEVNSI